MRTCILFLTFFVFSSFVDSSERIIDKVERDLQQAMNELVDKSKIPGITVSVVLGPESTINLAAGFAEKDKTLMKPQDRMLGGSTGKMYVSAIAMDLVQKRKILLKDPVRKYLKDKSWLADLPNGHSLTIQNLLQHTTGIPRYIFQPEFLASLKLNPLLDRTPEDCIAFILKKEPLFKAGKGFAYSDTNYLILGLIIEEVTGKSYNTLLRNFLAEHSFMNTDPSDSRILDGLVQGYIAQNVFNLPVEIVQNGELSINPAFEWTGGGTVTTASDLAKLAFLIHGNRLLDSTHYDLFVHPVNMRSGQVSDSGYGLGTFVWISGNDVKYGHSGFFPGYQSHVEYSTKYQYAISIQLNTDDGNINLRSISSKLEEILHKHMDAIDEEKIMANFAKQEACWNKNDILCYMEAYASDRLVETNSSRGVIYGYDKILDSYQNNYPADKMGMLHFDQLTTRKLSSSFYHVTGRYNLSDKTNDATRQGWFSAVMEKIRGDWYMITDHSS